MNGLIRACVAGGDDLASVRVRILYELRKLVSFDAAFLASADPETLLFTSTFAEEPLVEAAPLFLENEYGAAIDVNRFAVLAGSVDPVSSLDAATHGDRTNSPRWTEIMGPMGMGDEARVALRVDDTTWGFMCLHRSGSRGFEDRELATLRKAAPHIGEAIRRRIGGNAAVDAVTADAIMQGVIIVAGDSVVATGGAAEEWVAELDCEPLVIGGPLPLSLLAVVRRLTALESGDHRTPPAAVRFTTRRGALVTAHATRLRAAGGDGLVAVTLTPASASERSSLLLAAHGLTPAQRRVAQLVLQGRTTRQIVLELRISEYTVQDHLKAVFDKVGVRSRRELVAAVMQHPG